ncbi:MAG TPA: hypothetical protein VLG50_00970 [Candidatus Saccharimonadales bacterium]|nr:hypothetical protein [Candidatus Saccharimonadales bacterium]
MTYKIMQTFLTVLIRDARVFKQHIVGRMIDACVWAGASLYVAQYVLPKFGIDHKYASFLMLGNLAVWGMFEVGTNMAIILGDLQGTNSLSYYLTLPLPSQWIFIRLALMDTYRSIIPTLLMIPVGKLILLDNISLRVINYPKLFLAWILSHLFFGFFGLFLSSITPNFEYITTIRQRFIFPLWFLGCYQFSWYMLYEANPTLAYINLLNPVVYIMEGMRGAACLPIQTLPFSLCMLVTGFMTIVFAYLGIRSFQKRVDCL